MPTIVMDKQINGVIVDLIMLQTMLLTLGKNDSNENKCLLHQNMSDN
jgi:hypothetical protein